MYNKSNICRRYITYKFFIILFFLILPPSFASDIYPESNKTVNLVVNTAPGGTLDITARWLANKLSKKINAKIVVSNKPGANGNIAASFVKDSDSDGYTLYLINPNHLTNYLIDKNFLYDPYLDFTIIGPVIKSPMILMGTENSPVKNLNTLRNASIDQFTYTASQFGSGPHLGVIALEKELNRKFLYVPYKGAGNSYTDFLAGRVDFAMYIYPSAMSVIQNQKAIPLAISTSARLPTLPNVPTFNELGVKNLEIDTFYAIVSPKNLDSKIVNFLNQHLNNILNDKENISELNNMGLFPTPMSPNQTILFLKRQEEKLKPIIQQILLTK